MPTLAALKHVPMNSELFPYANPTHFRRLVGTLQYLTIIGSNITFVVNKLYQAMHSPLNLYLKK